MPEQNEILMFDSLPNYVDYPDRYFEKSKKLTKCELFRITHESKKIIRKALENCIEPFETGAAVHKVLQEQSHYLFKPPQYPVQIKVVVLPNDFTERTSSI